MQAHKRQLLATVEQQQMGIEQRGSGQRVVVVSCHCNE